MGTRVYSGCSRSVTTCRISVVMASSGRDSGRHSATPGRAAPSAFRWESDPRDSPTGSSRPSGHRDSGPASRGRRASSPGRAPGTRPPGAPHGPAIGRLRGAAPPAGRGRPCGLPSPPSPRRRSRPDIRGLLAVILLQGLRPLRSADGQPHFLLRLPARGPIAVEDRVHQGLPLLGREVLPVARLVRALGQVVGGTRTRSASTSRLSSPLAPSPPGEEQSRRPRRRGGRSWSPRSAPRRRAPRSPAHHECPRGRRCASSRRDPR